MANNGKKESRRALLDAEIAADPAVRRGKRLTAALLILWISARLFYLVMELICAKVGYFDFDAAGFVLFALSLLCAALMYRGMRYYSVLFLLLGALMILNTFLGRAYSALGLDLYLDLKLYYVSCVLDAWVQTAVMLCLLLSPCCRRYAEAAGRIREDLAYKGYRPQIPVSDTPEAEKKAAGQRFSRALVLLPYLLAGGLLGHLYARYGVSILPHYPMLRILLMFGMFYFAMVLQIVIHEAGHLVFGLLTGYRFSSFRIFGLMWIRQDGRLRLRYRKLAGTGGQCLMAPPDWREDLPCILYNLGGVLMNLISALLFWLLSRSAPPFMMLLLLSSAMIGLVYALINGLPLRGSMVDNDARNVLSILRSRTARRAFWLQLKITEREAAGERLSEMPEDWFSVPGDETPENSLIADVALCRARRLMEQRRFREAAVLQDRLLPAEDLCGYLLGMLRCDRMTCELLGEGDEALLSSLLPRAQFRFFGSNRRHPSVLRTQLALALLHDRDATAAGSLRAAFEDVAAGYPYPGVIGSERELLALIGEKAAAQE